MGHQHVQIVHLVNIRIRQANYHALIALVEHFRIQLGKAAVRIAHQDIIHKYAFQYARVVYQASIRIRQDKVYVSTAVLERTLILLVAMHHLIVHNANLGLFPNLDNLYVKIALMAHFRI